MITSSISVLINYNTAQQRGHVATLSAWATCIVAYVVALRKI
jgi:hypothetical protein